jgi:glycosyltransferase involved in cell wall biosynthesis
MKPDFEIAANHSPNSRVDLEAESLRRRTSQIVKVCIWTKIANHYQRAFVNSLGNLCDLRAVYFEKLPAARIALGWSDSIPLSNNEIRCDTLEEALRAVPDWRERIHIVPGYGGTFQRSLARHLSAHSIPWADWSESSTPGWKWYARLPVKLWWTNLLEKSSLGSFAIGSNAEDDFVRRGLQRSRISYLPYVSPSAEGPARPDSPMTSFKSGRRAFLFLGALNRRKGVDLLLKAAAAVLRTSSSWTLIFVGNDSPQHEFEKQVISLGLQSQIYFRGAVAPDLIPGVIAAADVLVLPSRYDGWGVVINEAVSGGLPVIASDRCGAARHLIVPGQNGFRVKAGSASDLETAMRRYTKSEGLCIQHGDASRLLARDVDPDLNARRMLHSLSTWMNDWTKCTRQESGGEK